MTPNSIFSSEQDKAEALDNWSLFDVHRWSDYPEINKAVNDIYNILLTLDDFKKGKTKVRKKHLKVILLDLYVKWLTDPDMWIGFYRMKPKYTKTDDRYNKLHIKYITVKIVDALIKLDLVEHHKGFFYSDKSKPSRVSRMRASERLIQEYFIPYNFTPEMVEKAPDTECIILRRKDEEDKKNKDIAYEDTEDTIRMRNDLYYYNNLLRSSFIAIPHFPEEGLKTKNKKRRIRANFFDKFVRRIFNNSSWENGGRFYGGFWQRLPKDWRSEIRIYNVQTAEIDYSGLHIMLLYKMKGIDYWEVTDRDPYILDGYEQSERMRDFIKLCLLVLINVSDEGKLSKAVRKKINFNKNDYGWVYDESLDYEQMIKDFSALHKPISSFFCSEIGINLQFYDSLIAEHVINHFSGLNIPVLCVHDSFIIQSLFRYQLEEVMQEGYRKILLRLNLLPSHAKVKISLDPIAKMITYGKPAPIFASIDTEDEKYDELWHKHPYWMKWDQFEEPEQYYPCDYD